MNWDEKFAEHDTKNPETYRLFKRFALELVAAGRSRISHGTIIERIRWQTLVHAQNATDDYKVNQNFGRPMAERFIREYPRYDGLFEFRKAWSYRPNNDFVELVA